MEYKIVFLVWLCVVVVDGAIYDLYNTKIATSDLKWTAEPRLSWEEVSGFDRYGAVIRSYQVCRIGVKENNNWLRSPFIRTLGANRVNVEIEFSITKCDWPGMNDDYCRQTFNLFYYESEQDVASSTFPPWQERPYVKVDTVAANSQNEINKKTFSISNLKSTGGIYIAAQDQGACMSLISLRVYYYYCPETTHSLAVFENTMVGEKTASLVTVPGTCVSNAIFSSRSIPKYYCGSTGQWQIITGSCQCGGGYEPNFSLTACEACPRGTFKLDSGNRKCITCPANSGPNDKMVGMEESWKGFASVVKSGTSGLKTCPCHPGYFRAKGEASDLSCTKPPSSPLPGTVTTNSTDAVISWATPLDLGGRSDQYYSVSCEICDPEDVEACEKCPMTVSFFVPMKGGSGEMIEVQTVSKLYKNEVTVGNLEPYTMYTIKISSHNGVSDSSNKQAAFLRVDALTKESVPSPVTDIYVADHSMNSVVIKWKVPENPRGIILGYELEIRQRSAISRATRASIRTSDSTTQSIEMKSIRKETMRTTITLDSLDADTEYLVRIRAKTVVGYGSYSSSVMFKTSKRGSVKVGKTEAEDGTGFLIAAVSSVLLLAVGCSGLVFYYSRKKRNTMERAKKTEVSNGPRSSRYDEVKENKNSVKRRSNNSDSMERAEKIYVDYPDPGSAVQDMNKEVDPSSVRLQNVIGEGEFALAYHAMMLSRGEMLEVAAKQLKEGASVKDQANFLKEACTMAQFNHPNIVQLRGVITKHKPVMIISEYMENGSLDQFLRERRGQFTIPQLLDMLRNIANGMRYLSRMQYIHRDLAARNILVSHDCVCKVSDFGLSRTLENDPHATYTTQGGKIALRWTAPECIRYRQFTSASDVWSFGIVMWEVMSYGEKPYWDMTNHEVVQSIGSGMRLPAPINCPKALHELMLECWSIEPKKRPTFSKIVSDLNRLLRHSALLVNSEEQSEPFVSNSINIGQRSHVDREYSFDDSKISNDDTESNSSMSDEDDTCSSSLNVDERCLKI